VLFREPRLGYELELPDGWVHGPREGEDTFFHHDRTVGVLSVTVTLARRGERFTPAMLDAFARRFLASQKGTKVVEGPVRVEHPGFEGFRIDATVRRGVRFEPARLLDDRGRAERFARCWFLSTGLRFFFVSYNCSLAERTLELATAEAIVASLTPLPIA